MSGTQPSGRRTARAITALAGVTLLAGCVAAAAPSARSAGPARHLAQAPARIVTAASWPAFLDGPLHRSYAPAQRSITPGNAAELRREWHAVAGQLFLASPTVADGAVFIGSNTGWFYRLSAATGKVEDKRFLGLQPTGTCYNPRGIIATATVAAWPGRSQGTVYVGAANGYLYALNAANLKTRWRSLMARPSKKVAGNYDWSSPTVADGKIYIGVASACERPQTRGAVIAYNQATGKKLAELYTVPRGQLGGGVWSSVAVGPSGDVYASTGSGPAGDSASNLSDSILKLAPRTLKLLARWRVSGDGIDFGGSPVLFGSLVGACNKDGDFYALQQSTLALAWQQQIGDYYTGGNEAECNGSPAYNGKDLFFAGTAVTIRGKAYRGSVQERSASTGGLVWENGLTEGVTGSPTLDGARVLAVGTYDAGSAKEETYLVNASTGRILRRLVSGLDFAQSVFADGWLFSANATGLYAWAPRHPA
jgi:outer membrane protein assembly factor BamB